jgi:hypothetical protein
MLPHRISTFGIAAWILGATSALNITIYQPGVSFAPSPLPPSHAESDGEEIIALFQNLGRVDSNAHKSPVEG